MNRIGAAVVVVGVVAGCKNQNAGIELTPEEAAACEKAGFGGMDFAPSTGNTALDSRCTVWAAQQRAARNASKGRDARPAGDFGR